MTEQAAGPEDRDTLMSRLNDNVVRLSMRLEQMNLAELIDVSRRPFRLMWLNFLAGLARGVGFFLGAGVMGAITLALITWMVYHLLDQLNWIPVIGQFSHAVGDILKQFLEAHPRKK